MSESEQLSMKRCPMCGEEILAIAVKCKHCQSMLDGAATSSGKVGGPPRVAKDLLSNISNRVQLDGARRSSTPRTWRFGETLIAFVSGSIPGFFMMGLLGAGAMIRVVKRSAIGDNWEFLLGRALALGLGAVVILGIPAALLFAGSLKLARGKNEAPVAAVVCAVVPWPIYWVFRTVIEEALIAPYGEIRDPSLLVLAALICSIGGGFAGWRFGQAKAGVQPTGG